MPLTQSAIAALKLYLEEAHAVFAREAGQVRLFVSSRSGGPLDDDIIVSYLSLILALAAGGPMAWTANLGGQVRHSEVRAGAANAGAPASQSESA